MSEQEYMMHTRGLTKREYFAGLAMQGFLSSWPDRLGEVTPKASAEYAVRCADELLKALEKQL